MKTIKNWNKFLNELNRETYISAADKLNDLGHQGRATELKKYANINKMGYRDLGLFDFKDNYGNKGYFAGLELGMTNDMFADMNMEIEEGNHGDWSFSTVVMFTDEESGQIFAPFWIEYNEKENKTYLINFDDDEGDEISPIYFSNRKDAVKFIKALQNHPQMSKDFEEKIDPEFDKLKEMLRKCFSQLKPNMFYRN